MIILARYTINLKIVYGDIIYFVYRAISAINPNQHYMQNNVHMKHVTNENDKIDAQASSNNDSQ